MNARRRGQTSRGRRRGEVFSVRVTEEEREKLRSLQQVEAGPRALGPWLLWSALRAGVGSTNPGLVVPARAGTTPAAVVPGPGSTDAIAAARYYPAGEVLPAPAERLILDLCAGTGAWSEPYRKAGYRVQLVTLPDSDVRLLEAPGETVWGVLAAPPCDQFSLARNGHPTPRDLLGALEVVSACLRVIAAVRPRWWALENPVGLLGKFLGTPRDVFQPCDFGDPWTKRTAIWGQFTVPQRGPFVKPLGGGPPCEVCDPTKRRTSWCSRPEHRAVTPPGFARAFFEANP